MGAQVCGIHYVLVQAMVLCLDCTQRDGEEVAAAGANRSLEVEREKDRESMLEEQEMGRESKPDIRRTELVTGLANMVDSLVAVLGRVLASRAGILVAAQETALCGKAQAVELGMLLLNNCRNLSEAQERLLLK